MSVTAMKQAKGRPEYAVPALDRGLDLLEALSASPTPQSLTDLARSLNYIPSGLFRLLARLGTRGYVKRDPSSNRYSLTLKLFELSHTHSPLESLVSAAAKPMCELAESVEESVHLSVLTQGRLLVLPRKQEQIFQIVKALGECAMRITHTQGLTYERRAIS